MKLNFSDSCTSSTISDEFCPLIDDISLGNPSINQNYERGLCFTIKRKILNRL